MSEQVPFWKALTDQLEEYSWSWESDRDRRETAKVWIWALEDLGVEVPTTVEMEGKTVYKYTDDGYWDTVFGGTVPRECYNAVGWSQNGSAHSLEELYADVLWAHVCRAEGADIGEVPLHNPYYVVRLEELQRILEAWDIIVEEA